MYTITKQWEKLENLLLNTWWIHLRVKDIMHCGVTPVWTYMMYCFNVNHVYIGSLQRVGVYCKKHTQKVIH